MLQNPSMASAPHLADGAANGNPYHLFGNQDKILSEIAEEDSISMISDKPRRFKPSDCVTPADPVTNSFMGSIRESHTNVTNTRLKETANRLVHENANNMHNAALAAAAATHNNSDKQQVFPYTSSGHPVAP